MSETMKHTWKRVKWTGNMDEPYASWECWQYGKVTVYPNQFHDGSWSYVALFGPNDNRSHSGTFGHLLSLEDVKAEIERRYHSLSK